MNERKQSKGLLQTGHFPGSYSLGDDILLASRHLELGRIHTRSVMSVQASLILRLGGAISVRAFKADAVR